MKRFIAVYFAVVLFTSCGCGVPESVRQANSFNIDAGVDLLAVADQLDAIAASMEVSAPPAAASIHALAAHLREVATNVRDGAKLVARKIGDPENPLPYTPAAHRQAIDQGNKDVDAQEAVKKGISGFFQNAVEWVGNKIWPGLGGLAIGGFLWLRKHLQFNALKAGIGPIVRVIEDHPQVKTAVADFAGKMGAGKAVDAVVQAFTNK